MKKDVFKSLLVCAILLSLLFIPSNVMANTSKGTGKMSCRVAYDESNNKRIINSDGKQTGFMMSYENQNARGVKSNDKSYVLGKEAIQSIASDFLATIVDQKEYEISDIKYYEDGEYYTVTYYNYLSGFKTQDYVFIDLDAMGNIIAYAAPCEGSMDNVDLSGISRKDLETQLRSQLSAKYDMNKIQYQVEDEIVKMDDSGKVFVNMYTKVVDEENFQTGEIHKVYLEDLKNKEASPE